MYSDTPQEIIRAAQPHREEKRPHQCKRCKICWVELSFGALTRKKNGCLYCVGCDAKIA